MEKLYIEKDQERGKPRTMLKLVEEVGELAEAILVNKKEKIEEELADILAWTLSLANLFDINLDCAFQNKYRDVCPDCQNCPCSCDSI